MLGGEDGFEPLFSLAVKKKRVLFQNYVFFFNFQEKNNQKIGIL